MITAEMFGVYFRNERALSNSRQRSLFVEEINKTLTQYSLFIVHKQFDY